MYNCMMWIINELELEICSFKCEVVGLFPPGGDVSKADVFWCLPHQ